MNKRSDYLAQMREGKDLTVAEQVRMVWQLSVPAILAQVSSVIMQYIDASMVGQLGADESASIGLISSSTWLIGGLCSAMAAGFTVQVAHKVGANQQGKARILVRHGLLISGGFSLLLTVIALSISSALPGWLGGAPEICPLSTDYFRIYALSLLFLELNHTAGGMLQCSGNMRIPGMLNILMCFLDVVFNALLIFEGRTISLGNISLHLPGAGLGVAGAALGTALSEVVCSLLMLYFLLVRSEMLHLRKERPGQNIRTILGDELKMAARIAIPQGFESAVMGSAYVAFTAIVAPLGTISIAANSFAITAESLCYMPGYGIGAAATTLVGQSFGAGRKDMTRRLAWLSTVMAVAVMTVMGALMYVFAPQMIGMLSPDPQVRSLGTMILRIEAFAEPMYAASIVINGAFRGMGDTLTSSILNLISMWCVRIPAAAFLAPRLGLRGVWFAMCGELCVRGLLFLARLARRKW